MGQWIQNNMQLVFFIYGLAFFIMGWSIIIRTPAKLNQFTKGLKLLAAFGILHGIVEWMDMYKVAMGDTFTTWGFLGYDFLRGLILGLSFYYLFSSGIQLFNPRRMRISNAILIVWLISYIGGIAASYLLYTDLDQLKQVLVTADILMRYFLATPSALLVALGLKKNRDFLVYHYDARVVRRTTWITVFFGLYAILAGLITPSADIGLAWLLNYPNFLALTGFTCPTFSCPDCCGDHVLPDRDSGNI